ncbi:iron-containing alcohol dehydrogenase [uncultured Succinivibrio sp.]|uniref:iron-containing alcohol dehydrogenase n=1 Tax=uncultured Succinivibrio sp. TaxID=540749 RepID=UPI0025CB8E5D|nr:iron-containing alcohol dehydrogenase [uncultured Succinivibrio sp.]
MDNVFSQGEDTFLFGPNQENEVGRQIKYLGGSKVLVIYSKLSSSIGNLLDKVRRSLRNSGLDYTELGESYVNPRISTVFDGIKICKTEDVDFILAVGSTSVCSVAKVIAAGAVFEDSFYEMFKNNSDIEKALPLAVISTSICGGCATSREVTVFNRLEDGSLKYFDCSSEVLTPKFIIYNPELCTVSSSNYAFNFVRLLDVLFRRYFEVNKNTVLAEKMLEATIKTVLIMFAKIKDKPNDVDCITNLMWASISAYVNPMLNYNDEACVPILEKALISVYDCNPEEAASIIIPAWFKFVLKKKELQIAKLGSIAFDIPYNFSDVGITASQTVDFIKRRFEALKLPVKLSELNGNAGDIEKILKKVGFPEIKTIGTNEHYTQTDCEVILSLAL